MIFLLVVFVEPNRPTHFGAETLLEPKHSCSMYHCTLLPSSIISGLEKKETKREKRKRKTERERQREKKEKKREEREKERVKRKGEMEKKSAHSIILTVAY